jgi:alpha-mannosidase
MSVVDPIPAKETALPEVLSFFSVDAPGVSISAVKKAEDDNAAVIRLYENGIGEANVNLKTYFKISNAEKTNLIEYDGTAIKFDLNSVALRIGSHSIETVKLSLK